MITIWILLLWSQPDDFATGAVTIAQVATESECRAIGTALMKGQPDVRAKCKSVDVDPRT